MRNNFCFFICNLKRLREEKTIYLIANDELFYTDYFIYDKSGKLLMSGKIKSEVTTINTDNLSNGNYFMTIANKFMQSFCVSKK